MNINLGKLDIVARFIVGIGSIAVGAYMAFALGNIYGLALGFVGGILTITGLMKWCPMYAIFGLRSCPLDASERR
jgi:Inner membrane protein YgaP-like, transmembrane domain